MRRYIIGRISRETKEKGKSLSSQVREDVLNFVILLVQQKLITKEECLNNNHRTIYAKTGHMDVE